MLGGLLRPYSFHGVVKSVSMRTNSYWLTPPLSMNWNASSTVREGARASVFENCGWRRGENFDGSKAPRCILKTQTYSRWDLFASDWGMRAESIMVIGLKSEKPLWSR